MRWGRVPVRADRLDDGAGPTGRAEVRKARRWRQSAARRGADATTARAAITLGVAALNRSRVLWFGTDAAIQDDPNCQKK